MINPFVKQSQKGVIENEDSISDVNPDSSKRDLVLGEN